MAERIKVKAFLATLTEMLIGYLMSPRKKEGNSMFSPNFLEALRPKLKSALKLSLLAIFGIGCALFGVIEFGSASIDYLSQVMESPIGSRVLVGIVFLAGGIWLVTDQVKGAASAETIPLFQPQEIQPSPIEMAVAELIRDYTRERAEKRAQHDAQSARASTETQNSQSYESPFNNPEAQQPQKPRMNVI